MNARLPALLLSVSLCACTAITDFDTSSISEDTVALCSDATDNDGNGLTDCQDFACREQAPCCTIPRVALLDEFNSACAQQSCEAPSSSCSPDPAVWNTWGTPLPVLCEGALAPQKIEQCYDVGVHSVASFELAPGLTLRARLVGQPEPRGRLEIGMTLQQSVVGSTDPCVAIDPTAPDVSIRLLADDDGYRFVAVFGGVDLATSPALSNPGGHQVTIDIGDDRRVTYAVDGVQIARSPADQPLPDPPLAGHVLLAGRGTEARFEDVDVTVGTECEQPDVWSPTEPFEVLSETPGQWDGFAVFAPDPYIDGAGDMAMLYGGCSAQAGTCDPLVAGLGMAERVGELSFAAARDCPLVGHPVSVCEDGLATPFSNPGNNLLESGTFELDQRRLALLSQPSGGTRVLVVDVDELLVHNGPDDGIALGSGDSWDSHEICCATAWTDGEQVLAWYAGRDGPRQPWQIGLARSDDGIRYVKHAGNPILQGGPSGSHDENGLRGPTVVYDRGAFRMWYEARGFFDTTSIGYAVSADGARWHKYPDNPVLSPGDIGVAETSFPAAWPAGGRILLFLSRGIAAADSRIYALRNLEDLTESTSESAERADPAGR